MAGVSWSQREEWLLRRLFPYLGSRAEVVFTSCHNRRTANAVTRKAREMGLAHDDFAFPPAPDDGAFTEPEKAAINEAWEQIESRMLRHGGPGSKTLRELSKPKLRAPVVPQSLMAEQIGRYLSHSIEQSGKVKLAKYKPRKRQRRLLALAHSDAHYGDVVHHPATGELLYDPATCLQRVREIPAMLEQRVQPGDVDGCVVFWLGDQITGEQIYPHQPHEIAACLADQVGDFHWHQWALITELAKRYGSCDVYCVPGNHGRAGKRHSPRTNWDRMLAQFMQLHAHYHSGDNVTVELCHHDVGVWDVLGHRVLVRHIGTRNDDTPARKGRLADWRDIHGYGLLVHGHFHTDKRLQYHGIPVVSNGTLKEPGSYAEERGLWGRPSQAWWIMTEDDPYYLGGRLQW